MNEILDAIEAWHANGDRVAVATVVPTRRSAPRPAGAKMAISEHGQIAGSVPGGLEGIAASLRATVSAAGKAKGLAIVLGDQPLLTPQAIAAVLDRAPGPTPAVRATFDGVPGHPVVIKRDQFADIGELQGGEGARDLLDGRGLVVIECGHLASAHDVDTLADLRAAERLHPQGDRRA